MPNTYGGGFVACGDAPWAAVADTTDPISEARTTAVSAIRRRKLFILLDRNVEIGNFMSLLQRMG